MFKWIAAALAILPIVLAIGLQQQPTLGAALMAAVGLVGLLVQLIGFDNLRELSFSGRGVRLELQQTMKIFASDVLVGLAANSLAAGEVLTQKEKEHICRDLVDSIKENKHLDANTKEKVRNQWNHICLRQQNIHVLHSNSWSNSYDSAKNELKCKIGTLLASETQVKWIQSSSITVGPKANLPELQVLQDMESQHKRKGWLDWPGIPKK